MESFSFYWSSNLLNLLKGCNCAYLQFWNRCFSMIEWTLFAVALFLGWNSNFVFLFFLELFKLRTVVFQSLFLLLKRTILHCLKVKIWIMKVILYIWLLQFIKLYSIACSLLAVEFSNSKLLLDGAFAYVTELAVVSALYSSVTLLSFSEHLKLNSEMLAFTISVYNCIVRICFWDRF